MRQTSTKGVQNKRRLSEERGQLGIMPGTEIWQFYQILYTQNSICPGQNSLGFRNTNWSPNPGQTEWKSPKKNLPYGRLPRSGKPQIENEKKLKERQVLGPCQKSCENDSFTNYNGCTLNGPKSLHKETVISGNRRTGWNYLNTSIIKIDQNTEKSPGDPRRLAVTLTPVNTAS